jgi:hypothetical protein
MSDTFYKIMKVIGSCETEDHFTTSQRMIDLFSRQVTEPVEPQYLQRWLNKRMKLKNLA